MPARSLFPRTGFTEGFYRRNWSEVPSQAQPSTIPGAGALRAPGELGRHVSDADQENNNDDVLSQSTSQPQVRVHPRVLKRRQRIDKLVTANRQAERALEGVIRDMAALNPSAPATRVTSLYWEGSEVIFATTAKPACYAMDARTQFVFQVLDLPSQSAVVSIQSNLGTGQILIAQADGQIQTYLPKLTNPAETAFGRTRWINGALIECKSLFYTEREPTCFKDYESGNPGERLDVSCSQDYKVLVAHRDQLAVFDTNPMLGSRADLLWTTKLPGCALMAKIAGDGNAIAAVVEEDDDDGADGVHTFERDSDDGSNDVQQRIPLVRSKSIGILYKPGPFLVHASPVSRLSFRGLGHVTSQTNKKQEQGNDLLLTYSKSDCVARVFGQNNWKPLVEWSTPPLARVDWIRGVSSMSLGDLESEHRPKPRKENQTESKDAKDDINLYEAIGRRQQFQTVPSHATPSSHAGAWISEICFQGVYPSLRLSRLTYLKRGVDDLTPTLFESVSSFLPAACIFAERVLETDDSGFCIDGIWPAWNPWLSESSNLSTTEALRGSAMRFLGLSSGPGSLGGGGFGDSLLGGTQMPPIEIRLFASHILSGKATLLEFQLVGDQSLTSLDLGNPMRAVLSMNDLDEEPKPRPMDCRERCTLEYGSDRLVAELDKDSRRVLLSYRSRGTMTFLPYNWLPEDVGRIRTSKLLETATRFQDESLVPAPQWLPPLLLPKDIDSKIDTIMWWPDEAEDGGLPILVAITSDSNLIGYEVPPPCCFQEAATCIDLAPVASTLNSMVADPSVAGSEESRHEYDVSIIPDPDHGLGLRLESQFDSRCAMAGSFKRHPITGDSLPAERSGMIILGDELISANGVALDNMSFDEVIAAVREAGAVPGNPIRLRFRRKTWSQRRRVESSDSGRRSMEQIIGVTPKALEEQCRVTSAHSLYEEAAPDMVVTITVDREWCAAQVLGVLSLTELNLERPEMDSGTYFSLVSCTEGSNQADLNRNALVIYVEGRRLRLFLLTYNLVGSIDLRGLEGFEAEDKDSSDDFVAHSARRIEEGKTAVTLCDRTGICSCVIISHSDLLHLTFQIHKMFKLPDPPRRGTAIRFISLAIVVIAIPFEGFQYRDVLVWSASTRPSKIHADYVGDYQFTDISVGVVAGACNSLVNFELVNSGVLESSPALILYSSTSASLFLKPLDSFFWLEKCHMDYPIWKTSSLAQHSRTPLAFDLLPHLFHCLRMVFSTRDEQQLLRSDWNPESMLARLILDKRGVGDCLVHHAQTVFKWLSTEANDCDCEGSLAVVPDLLAAEYENDNKSEMPSAASRIRPGIAEEKSLMEFQSLLYKNISTDASLKESPSQNGLVMSKDGRGEAEELPQLLDSLPAEDRRILWSIGELVLDQPPFERVDLHGQLFVLSYFLSKKLRLLPQGEEEKQRAELFLTPLVLRRMSQAKPDESQQSQTFPSAASMAGLLCKSQSILIDVMRRDHGKLDWFVARESRIPFWLRSDVALAKICEEIGQNMFREDRDILECAIFFIVARKMATLRNLAATDQSQSGKTFYKFLTSHDFSSDRGRRAAEKNAFSLLRKCKYRVASAFFLLSEPPSLKSALETIVTKMRDLELAFLVGRLMESKLIQSQQIDSGFTRGYGLAGLGGGGGYASSGSVPETTYAEDADFNSWNPLLGKATKRLLVERLLPMSSDDKVITSVQLLWIMRKEEASWVLSGAVDPRLVTNSARSVENTMTWQLESLSHSYTKETTAKIAAKSLGKTNKIIDFVSAPVFLKYLHSTKKPKVAGSLIVARTLMICGVELSCAMSLICFDGMEGCDHKEAGAEVANDSETKGSSAATARMNASLCAPQNTTTALSKSHMVESSIFDSFDAPPKVSRLPHTSQSSGERMEVKSSIFDDFDVPASHVETKPAFPGNTDVNSSIFDSFSVQPVPASSALTSHNNQNIPTSSIFDSFDVPMQGLKNAPPASFLKDGPRSTSPNDDGGSDEDLCNSVIEIAQDDYAPLWDEWKRELLLIAAARRLLREIATLPSIVHGDPVDPSVHSFCNRDDPLVSMRVPDVLQLPCDADQLLGSILQSMQTIGSITDLEPSLVVECALRILGSYHFQRPLFSVVLYILIGREDVAESIISKVSANLLGHCKCFSFLLDDIHLRGKTKGRSAVQFIQREAARLSWQLESCLWLHRGGGLSLSGEVFKQAVVAVRLGILTAGWNRSFECIECMLRTEPDCAIDKEAGRLLWGNLKTGLSVEKSEDNKKMSSGGWEFLVDCKRSQATQMLRERQTGCFIIRPHPDDYGIFTLSFKTNLVPEDGAEGGNEERSTDGSGDEQQEVDAPVKSAKSAPKRVRKDDVVQHAIIRLSDSGFRCGSFGPFASLIQLLQAVSNSLPFNLRFDLPPVNRVIKEEGSQPSPNTVFLRKLALRHADSIVSCPPGAEDQAFRRLTQGGTALDNVIDLNSAQQDDSKDEMARRTQACGIFLEALVLSEIQKQICSVVGVPYEYIDTDDDEDILESRGGIEPENTRWVGFVDPMIVGIRLLGTLLRWCRCKEIAACTFMCPDVEYTSPVGNTSSVDVTVSSEAFEVQPSSTPGTVYGGDTILRRMIQRKSGVDFTTLRLVDGGECTMIVLFSRKDAIKWLVTNEFEINESDASARLDRMEKGRVIEQVDLSRMALKSRASDLEEEGLRYRFLDPWEVEAIHGYEGETRNVSIGRCVLLSFSLAKVAIACEDIYRSLGGLPLLELWSSCKGGVALTKALATALPPWERAAGGDLQTTDGIVTDPPPYINGIRQHLYRNALYRRLGLPQRFIALVQVELLDLKNLTAPGGSAHLTVYGLLRLKRQGSGAALTNKARTLDSAATHPVRLGRSSGPNAPASWGSVVRFRFPLPEDVAVDGTSSDQDRETLFKGPPSVLQISVYEKKLLVDHSLGTADIRMDDLWAGGQLEEWVPLRSDKHGIQWFARVRLTLRFDLMCLAAGKDKQDLSKIPSVGLQRIEELSRAGGAAHEDMPKRSLSSPDLMTYFENIVY